MSSYGPADSQVFLKMMKHSTDTLPQPQASSYSDRAAPPTTNLSSHVDSLGVLLGLDLDGVLEIEDSFALPVNESAVGGTSNARRKPGDQSDETEKSYSSNLMRHLREVQTPDSPVGIYLSTNNGGSITKTAIDLLLSVEKLSNRGRGIVIIHDRARASNGDLGVKAWRLSDGARDAAKKNKWDSVTYVYPLIG